MYKRIISALILVLMLAMTATATEVPDLERIGSISFDMIYQGERVPGGSLTLYRVAAVGNDYRFAFVEAFADCGVSLENLGAAETAQALADYAATNGIQGTRKEIDDKGHITFTDLELGLYLLVQEDAAPGYEAARPFLVTVPVNENGVYIYDVNATPKLQLEQVPTEPPTDPPTEPTEPTEPDLPQTGQNNWPVPVMGILGVVLMLFGIALRLNARRDPYES